MRDVLGQKFFTDEISEELQYVPLNQVIKEVHEMPISKMTAHKGSILPISGIPSPLDNNTYTYMNFNKNLVGAITPTYPTINHNNVIYNQDSFDGIMTQGKHGKGITIDEYTKNEFTFDTSFESFDDGDAVGFTSQLGGDLFLGVSSEKSFIGNKSLKVRGSNRVYRTHPILVGDFCCISAWVYSETAGQFLRIEYNGGNYSWSGYTGEPHKGTGWEKLSVVPSVIASSNTTCYCFLYSLSGVDSYWDELQLEKKNYYTSFLQGTRNPSYLTYNIDTNPKTISFWFKSNSNKVGIQDNERTLLTLGGPLGAEGIPYLQCRLTRDNETFFVAQPNKVTLIARIESTVYHCKIDLVDAIDGDWHHVVLELNKGNKIGLWVDGNYAESVAYPMETNFGSILRVGHAYIPSSQSQTYEGLANAAFDDICIRTAHYEEDEILQWYHSNREFYNPYDYSLTV